MRRFRIIRGGLGTEEERGDPGLSRRLRSLYAPPADGYWDGFDATIMAAVRAGRAAPAAAAGWCQTLARWARPGLAAATVLMGVVGGVYLQTRGSRADATYRAVLEEPAFTIEPLDEEFARAGDSWGERGSSPRKDAVRDAADLLTDGVKRHRVAADIEAAVIGDGIAPADTVARDADSARTAQSVRHRRPTP